MSHWLCPGSAGGPACLPVPVPCPSPSHGSPPALDSEEHPWGHFGLGTVVSPAVPSAAPCMDQTPSLLLSGGLQSRAGSQGLLPAPLLVGGLWMPAWLTQPLALGRAFVSAAESVRGREGAWPGPGQLRPRSAGSAEPTLSPQSCASSEDDSLSFRSRAASCATDSTSEDALSIRSEMIQRKGTRLGGGGMGGTRAQGVPGGSGSVAGELGSALAWPRASAGIWGPLGEMRAALAESERWGWARGMDRQTDRQRLLPAQTVRLVPLWVIAVPEPGLSQSISGSGKCWGYWGHWAPHTPAGPSHASRRFHIPTTRLLSQILGEGWQEEEGEEDNGAGHPPACPQGAG